MQTTRLAACVVQRYHEVNGRPQVSQEYISTPPSRAPYRTPDCEGFTWAAQLTRFMGKPRGQSWGYGDKAGKAIARTLRRLAGEERLWLRKTT